MNIKELEEYLIKNKREEKIEWTSNITQTSRQLLGVSAPKIKEIANIIFKDNYLLFLDKMPDKYYEEFLISAYLISKIKDFDLQKKYLYKYAEKVTCWSECDTLKLKIKNKEKEYLEISKDFIKSNKIYIRRIGIIILFNFINSEYIDKIFKIISNLKEETEYYVNMAISWLLCECFIKERLKTIEFLEKNKLNSFVINKTISKCRDSYRVSKDDKEMLLKYKGEL